MAQSYRPDMVSIGMRFEPSRAGTALIALIGERDSAIAEYLAGQVPLGSIADADAMFSFFTDASAVLRDDVGREPTAGEVADSIWGYYRAATELSVTRRRINTLEGGPPYWMPSHTFGQRPEAEPAGHGRGETMTTVNEPGRG